MKQQFRSYTVHKVWKDGFSFGKRRLYLGKFLYNVKIFIFELHIKVANCEKHSVKHAQP